MAVTGQEPPPPPPSKPLLAKNGLELASSYPNYYTTRSFLYNVYGYKNIST